MNEIGLDRGGDGPWLYSLNGLTLVYLYSQIPLNALALAMFVCVALVMGMYALLQRRAARWMP